LRSVIRELFPASLCICGACFSSLLFGSFFRRTSPYCPIWPLLRTVGLVITGGIAAVFVNCSEGACIFPQELQHICWESELGLTTDQPRGYNYEGSKLGTTSLHCVILGLIDPSYGYLGASNGVSSIFPYTVLDPTLTSPHSVLYRVEDGQFHDGRSYYRKLISLPESEPYKSRPRCISGINDPLSVIVPSNVGMHSGLVISGRPTYEGLLIRTVIRMNGKEVNVDFLELQLSYMALNIACECSHNPRTPLGKSKVGLVMTTSVASPLANGDLISIALTHHNPEAQFLCCETGYALFHDRACLDCAVEEAIRQGFKLIIQS